MSSTSIAYALSAYALDMQCPVRAWRMLYQPPCWLYHAWCCNGMSAIGLRKSSTNVLPGSLRTRPEAQKESKSDPTGSSAGS
eukprot:353060-Rhodomonas_salina.5